MLKEREEKKLVVQCAHFVERERGKKNSERTMGPRGRRNGLRWLVETTVFVNVGLTSELARPFAEG